MDGFWACVRFGTRRDSTRRFFRSCSIYLPCNAFFLTPLRFSFLLLFSLTVPSSYRASPVNSSINPSGADHDRSLPGRFTAPRAAAASCRWVEQRRAPRLTPLPSTTSRGARQIQGDMQPHGYPIFRGVAPPFAAPLPRSALPSSSRADLAGHVPRHFL